MLRIRELAPNIQRLPATLDEAGRRQLGSDDHYIAAYYMVGCAIERAIKRPDLAHILRQTLNFQEEANFLEDRRSFLVAEFDMRSKMYGLLEKEAYVQLAGVLVAARLSPCSEPEEHNRAPERLSVDLKLTFERESDLRWLLTLLTVDKREATQRIVASRILDQLPKLKALADNDPLTDLTFVLAILGQLIVDMSRRKLLFAQIIPTFSYFANVERPIGFRPVETFYSSKARTIKRIAEHILKMEDEDMWKDQDKLNENMLPFSIFDAPER